MIQAIHQSQRHFQPEIVLPLIERYRETVELLQGGPNAPLEAERREIEGELSVILYKVARQWSRKASCQLKVDIRRLENFEDLIQDAVVYALKSTAKFDLSRRSSLLSFWTRCCTNVWRSALRKANTRQSLLKRYAEHKFGSAVGSVEEPEESFNG